MLWLSRFTFEKRAYQRYRHASRELHMKIMRVSVDRRLLEKAAKKLGIWQQGVLMFDSEGDLDILMDFTLYEMRGDDGKNPVERYAEEKGGEDAIERELLSAMVRARTALFKVKRVFPQKSQIELEDLVNPSQSLILTDIHFSQSLHQDLLMFFRPIQLARFTMTSGIAFLFPMALEGELVMRWRRLERKGDAERFVWFFKKNKRDGFSVTYADV